MKEKVSFRCTSTKKNNEPGLFNWNAKFFICLNRKPVRKQPDRSVPCYRSALKVYLKQKIYYFSIPLGFILVKKSYKNENVQVSISKLNEIFSMIFYHIRMIQNF